jgi:hypothetical protein
MRIAQTDQPPLVPLIEHARSGVVFVDLKLREPVTGADERAFELLQGFAADPGAPPTGSDRHTADVRPFRRLRSVVPLERRGKAADQGPIVVRAQHRYGARSFESLS